MRFSDGSICALEAFLTNCKQRMPELWMSRNLLLAATDPRFRAELETYWTGSAYQVRMMNRVRGNTETLIAAIKPEQRK